MKYRLYHNSRCRKSREGLEFVESKGLEVEIIEYMKDNLQPDELRELLQALEMTPNELCRKAEANYKEFVKGKDLNNEELIEIMVTYPKLIERPILLNTETKKAAVGRPVDQFLNAI